MMPSHDDEEPLLHSVALQNASSILAARQRAEDELLRAKEAIEAKTEELAKSLSMLRATLESTTDGILVTDEHTNVTDFNDRFATMWRVPREEIVGGNHRQLLQVTSLQFADPRAFLERVDAIYQSWPPDSYDLLEFADGRVFERFSKTRYVDERTVGRVWSFRDITQWRRTEEALRDETRLLEITNRTGAMVASTLDLPSLVQTVTDAATQVSGAAFGAFIHNVTDANREAYMPYTLSGAAGDAFEHFG
ncbi:MAG: PAS domain S-box protein, partial [Pseudomonadota bacterium]|nr:PAS domain S-box protein [Pseudomonadota bacterium]